MTKEMYVMSFGFAALIAATNISHAQSAQNCASHDAVVQRLAEGYGESRQSIALAGDNSVVEVFASVETGTWTITVTKPGGPTCLVASGHAYETLAENLPAQGRGT